LVLNNKYYEPDEEVSQYMRENCEFIGIFFGAFRNKPTKHFVTYLNKFYRYMQQRDEPFDIIYMPLDEDESECDFFVNACMEEWLVVPWTQQNLRRNVRNLYNVLSSPWLVIVKNDDEGTVVSYDGKTDLFECGYFALIEWKSMYKKVLAEVNAANEKKEVRKRAKTMEEEKLKEKLSQRFGKPKPEKEGEKEKEKQGEKEKEVEKEKEKGEKQVEIVEKETEEKGGEKKETDGNKAVTISEEPKQA